jgi:hypothetical protein
VLIGRNVLILAYESVELPLRNRFRRASESHLFDEDIKSISRGELVHFGIKDWQMHLLSYKLASFSELLHRLPTYACNYLAA